MTTEASVFTGNELHAWLREVEFDFTVKALHALEVWSYCGENFPDVMRYRGLAVQARELLQRLSPRIMK